MFLSILSPFALKIETPFLSITTNSLSSKRYTSLVYLITAGISEAIKFSPFPNPTISGLSFLTAISLSCSSPQTTPKA